MKPYPKFGLAVLAAVVVVGGAMFMALARRLDAAQAFERLVDEMNAAQEAHIDAIIAERDRREAGGGGEGAVSGGEPDPRQAVLARMDELARRTEGTPEGATIALGTLAWGFEVDAPMSTLTAAFDRLVRHYPNDPVVDRALEVVGRATEGGGDPGSWTAPLEELARASKSKETRVGAWMTLGQARLAAGDAVGARKAFQDVLAAQPAMDVEKRAAGYLFEVDHLQVGMVAPDFSTRTVEEQPINLASLRGKTVLLNFWASW